MFEIIRQSDHCSIPFIKPYINNYFLASSEFPKYEINGLSLRSMREEEINLDSQGVNSFYTLHEVKKQEIQNLSPFSQTYFPF